MKWVSRQRHPSMSLQKMRSIYVFVVQYADNGTESEKHLLALTFELITCFLVV